MWIIAFAIVCIVFFICYNRRQQSVTIYEARLAEVERPLDIETLNQEASQKSLNNYEEYLAEQCQFLSSTKPHLIIESTSLNSLEKAFLKYIDGSSVTHFSPAQYWYYEHGLDYKEVINMFLGLGLIEITHNSGIEKCTIPQLKEVLSKRKLPVSGKKSDLIARVQDNFSAKEIDSLLPSGDSFYKLTSAGKEQTATVQKSATHNTDLEDKCLNFIKKGEYYKAYSEIASYRKNKPGSFGLGINWVQESEAGLSASGADFYENIIKGAQGDTENYCEAFILCDMLGCPHKVSTLLKRLLGNIDQEPFDSAQFRYRSAISMRDIDGYKRDGTQKYEILTTLDESTCSICKKMNGKRLSVAKAQIGINFPPFHSGCRCCTVPDIS